MNRVRPRAQGEAMNQNSEIHSVCGRRDNQNSLRSRSCRSIAPFVTCAFFLCALLSAPSARAQSPLQFSISFPTSVRSEPLTGRVFVIVTKTNQPEPRIQLLSEGAPPFFGEDVTNLKPGQDAIIDADVPGYPLASLKDLPAGDYYVEAFLNVYTEFHRADGHTVWAHQDWIGELPTLAPGNPYSAVQKMHLDPEKGFDIHLSMDKVISDDEFTGSPILAQLAPPRETQWIKIIKFQSPSLTKFWGQPMYLGATILLPKDYDSHPNSYYPVVYNQGHFYQPIPWEFDTDASHETPEAAAAGKASGLGTGYEFYQAWISQNFPRFIMVTWQHPCPYFDDSYAVNSDACGPFGDAIMNELIPYIESHFRIIRQSYARIVEGGSTGGWESLALQLYHPKFFGGAWVFDPDPIDFRSFQQTNLYDENNAFDYQSPSTWFTLKKPWSRTPRGLVRSTVEETSHYEDILGPNGRSDYQLDGWWGIFCPVGPDGYPQAMWNMQTGEINHEVVNYAREHGYDLTDYAQTHWSEIGPDLVGKLHFFVGDMDSYYLNLAVYRMEDFLKTSKPFYDGSFAYGRPMKGHGWHPMTWADLLRDMAAQVKKNAPSNADTSLWNY